jgi:hypothetical protein
MSGPKRHDIDIQTLSPEMLGKALEMMDQQCLCFKQEM